MTAVANSELGASKLLWSGGDVNTVGASKTQRLGTATWASSSKMSRSHHGGEVGGGKALLVAGGKELQQGNKHTWPRRRDVSSLWYFLRPICSPQSTYKTAWR